MTQTKAELLQTKNQGDIRLGDADSSHYVGFKAPTTVSANKVWTLPAADGSANQVLTTNGSGVLTWAAGGGLSSDAQFNTVGGTNAGDSFTGTDANYNTLIGYDAGTAITSGDNNTVFGYKAGEAITTVSRNSFFGYQAGRYTTGYNNTFIGENCGQGSSGSTTSYNGTGLGKGALYSSTTGGGNTSIGMNSGYAVTTGYDNTLIGYQAGNTLTTGRNNICIGYESAPSSNTVDHEITFGNSSISTLRCQVTSISALSDRRDKTDINTLDLGLNFINALNPVKFKWNSREGILKDGSYEAGFIAQDFQESQKDFNAEYLNLVLDTNPEKLEAAPGKLIPIMVQAIKELSAEVQALKNS
jgi:hypothetical protein